MYNAVRENCGILAVIGPEFSMDYVVSNLIHLQHRGQESAGAATFHEGDLIVIKGAGLVSDVFSNYTMRMYRGKCAIGGTRYSTIGDDVKRDAKPIARYINLPKGEEIDLKDAYLIRKPISLEDTLQIAIDHNGNDPFFIEKKKEASQLGVEFETNNDVEGFLFEQVKFIVDNHPENQVNDTLIFQSIKYAANSWKGAICLVELVNDSVFVFRDRFGIKPLVWGYKDFEWGRVYAVASESAPLTQMGFPLEKIKSFPPGYAAKFKPKEKPHFKKLFNSKKAYCIFEYPYFARVDSFINDISIAQFRYDIGVICARDFKKKDIVIDAVSPIPDTARTSAIAFAYELGLPYREDIIIRNRHYNLRAFMLPDNLRSKGLSGKYIINKWPVHFPNSDDELRSLMLIDDSIVRGETMKKIVSSLRESFSSLDNIYVYSMFLPIRFPCPYGIDMQRRSKLIAHNSTLEEIANKLGVTAVFYPTLEMYEEALKLNSSNFCKGCSYGDYPTGLTLDDLKHAEEERELAHKSIF
ncbi:MAG: hypothetical protein J7K22_03000 [Nanoarchaeota archaeon]|nr:hypothetical protein [Nanoarchaeota archaeon]